MVNLYFSLKKFFVILELILDFQFRKTLVANLGFKYKFLFPKYLHLIIHFCISVYLSSNSVYFANTAINFFCAIDCGDGIQWFINDSIYTEGTIILDSSFNIGLLWIANSSSIENGTTIQCKATSNGTTTGSSRKIVVILQGTSNNDSIVRLPLYIILFQTLFKQNVALYFAL